MSAAGAPPPPGSPRSPAPSAPASPRRMYSYTGGGGQSALLTPFASHMESPIDIGAGIGVGIAPPSSPASQRRPGAVSAGGGAPRKHAWHRVLYEHQPYADNYIDPVRFLDQLRVVTPVVNLSAAELLFSSIMVVEELTSVALFFTVYLYLMRPGATAWPLISIEAIVMIGGYFTLKLYDSELMDVRTAAWNIALFCCYVRIIAPILQSLTSSYSDDTIHALSLLFSAVHMLTQDYKYMRSVSQRFSGTLSLNAAMFTAVLLASRFESLDKTSGFMGLAMIVYYVTPSVIRFLYARSPIAYVSTAAALWAIVTVLLAKLDSALFVAYESIVFFVLVVSPFGLRFIGGMYKRSLRGPWDIADIPEVDAGKEE